MLHARSQFLCSLASFKRSTVCTGFILYGRKIKPDFDTVVINLVGSLHYHGQLSQNLARLLNRPTYFGYFFINTTGNNRKVYLIFNDLYNFINDM